MAEPTLTMNYNDETTGTDAVPVWVTVGAGTITFTGAGSSNGDMKPVQRPSTAGAVMVANELWIDTGTDDQVLYDGGGQEVANASTDVFTSDPTVTNMLAMVCTVDVETQAGELEAWDNTSYNTTANEIINGTTATLSGHSQVRACFTASNVAAGAGAGAYDTGSPNYVAQLGTTTIWQLQGSTRIQTASAAIDATSKHNRIALHLLVAGDSAAGADSCELTYKYYYT